MDIFKIVHAKIESAKYCIFRKCRKRQTLENAKRGTFYSEKGTFHSAKGTFYSAKGTFYSDRQTGKAL